MFPSQIEISSAEIILNDYSHKKELRKIIIWGTYFYANPKRDPFLFLYEKMRHLENRGAKTVRWRETINLVSVGVTRRAPAYII